MSSDLFGEPKRERDLPASGSPQPGRPALPEPAADAPLAERMRPRSAAEIVGQAHLVGPGRLLERMLRGELVQSLILWGPPGSGKTTLARLVAEASGLAWVPFSAVTSGIREIKELMAAAERRRALSGRRTLLFVDEIHRFNKAQQDAFLPYVEKGDIVLVGATTENPSFEVVSPLLSRARVVVLQPLGEDALVTLLERALADPERGLGGRLCAERAALARIAAASDGDARRALTLLEAAAGLAGGEPGAPAALVDELLVEALQKKTLRYDKSGEEHYNLVSALHKSVRNCDADASVYWITRMLAAGEDRDFLARRLVRMAIEDVGLADPAALGVTLDAADAWHRLGSPEGELALVMAAAHLARAPKSNAVDSAYRAALADVERTSQDPVPLHLCNAPTGLMKAHGYGEGYRYAHDDPAAVGQMPCLPPGLAGRRYLHARVIRPAIQPPGPDTPRAAGSIRPERPPHGSPGGPDRA